MDRERSATKVGLANMESFESLPYLKGDIQVHYEGSIDKRGANADWDWWLYQDENGEWVIFDVDGPGCIYNFVQHRYPTSEEPTFKFYFDGEKEPRFTIRHSEFGEKYPFIEPLASRYIGPTDNGRGPIRVVRSFVPMPFKKSCKVTSTVKLKGYSKAEGDGGWGHIIYHTYAAADGVETFTGNENYEKLINLWKNVGADPKDTKGNEIIVQAPFDIGPGESRTIFERVGQGSIAALKLQVQNFTREHLKDVWIRIHWDGHKRADVYCPIGAFFGNELGYNNIIYK